VSSAVARAVNGGGEGGEGGGRSRLCIYSDFCGTHHSKLRIAVTKVPSGFIKAWKTMITMITIPKETFGTAKRDFSVLFLTHKMNVPFVFLSSHRGVLFRKEARQQQTTQVNRKLVG